MAIDGFGELCNTIYIAKMLHILGKSDLIALCLSDEWEYDCYYADMYYLLEYIFPYHRIKCLECRGVEVHVLSDPVIVDFYKFAGKYGKRKGIPDEDNPYIKEAEHQTDLCLGFSYAMDWKLMGYTEPKRPYHSRLGLFICYDSDFDMGFLVYRLLELCKWFSDACEELHSELYGGVCENQITLWEEAMAA